MYLTCSPYAQVRESQFGRSAERHMRRRDYDSSSSPGVTKVGATTTVFAENLIGLGFLKSVYYIESIPTHEKMTLLWEKRVPNTTFNLIFLGLGWPWVGEFVGFIVIIFIYICITNITCER